MRPLIYRLENIGADGPETNEAWLCREAAEELRTMKLWIDDLQSGMYINCVYCGHRYGPEENPPMNMADVLKEHIEQCKEHPMNELRQENENLNAILEGERHKGWSHEVYNIVDAIGGTMCREFIFHLPSWWGDGDTRGFVPTTIILHPKKETKDD